MYKKIVVCIIHFNKEILFQLRDFNKTIIHPGKWGFFSGSVKVNESSFTAIKRELKEELNITNFKNLKFLSFHLDASEKNIYKIYTLKVFKKKFTLLEGEDFGFFKKYEFFQSKRSKKLNCFFNNADQSLMNRLIKSFWKKL